MRLRPAVRFLLYAVLVFAPLARGGVQDWAIAVIQMLVLAAAGVYLVDAAWRWEWRWNRTALDLPFLAMFGLALVSTLFSVYPPASWRAMGLLATYLLFYGLAAQVFDSRRRKRELVWLVFGLSVVLTGIGFIKLWNPTVLYWWEYADIWLRQHDRMSASFGNPNHFGAFLGMALLIMIGWTEACRTSGGKLVAWLTIGFVLFGLVLTLSRGAWAGFLTGLFWISLMKWKGSKFVWKKGLLGLGVGLVMLLIIMTGTQTSERAATMTAGNDSLGMRKAIWGGAYDMIKEKPLQGFGAGTFFLTFPKFEPVGFDVRFHYAHNDWLEYSATMGFGFILLSGWVLSRFLSNAWKTAGRTQSRYKKSIAAGGSAAVVAIAVHCLVDFNTQIPANALFLAVILAFSRLRLGRQGMTGLSAYAE